MQQSVTIILNIKQFLLYLTFSFLCGIIYVTGKLFDMSKFMEVSMNKILTTSDISASYSAIKRYVEYRKENCNRHNARVLISSKRGTLFNDILYIFAEITSENASVIIEGNNIYARDFMSEYKNESNHFTSINGTLLIKSTDIWGNDIEVNISNI